MIASECAVSVAVIVVSIGTGQKLPPQSNGSVVNQSLIATLLAKGMALLLSCALLT